jgi:hypothetical protein
MNVLKSVLQKTGSPDEATCFLYDITDSSVASVVAERHSTSLY